MKVAIMFSGGKDSTFAIDYAKHMGWEISYLLSVKPTRTDCYLFHYATVEHTPQQAEAMGLNHFLLGCDVANPKQEAQIVRSFVEKNKVDALILGGVGLQVTQLRSLQKALMPSKTEVFASHAGYDHEEIIEKMIKKGYDIRITQVASEGLGSEWLGKQITKTTFEDLKKRSQKYGFHIGFEGGYADTFVCDGPIFKKRIILEEAEKVMEDKYSGYLMVKKLRLVDKVSILR
ncbi:diphthine--ammonia ligase [Candidatus Woesearchaeota archaeon]|nr:diphthine--ammonia ligase [Candidatus Woesearchaeota archaeon]